VELQTWPPRDPIIGGKGDRMSTTRTTLEATGPLDQAVHPAVEALRLGGTDAILAAAGSVAPVLAGRADEYDQLGVYPVESIAALWSTGLWALSIPAERGPSGPTRWCSSRAPTSGVPGGKIPPSSSWRS